MRTFSSILASSNVASPVAAYGYGQSQGSYGSYGSPSTYSAYPYSNYASGSAQSNVIFILLYLLNPLITQLFDHFFYL